MANTDTTIPIEIWKSVPGFEGLYSVSNLGRVRRDKAAPHTRVGKILKPSYGNRKYPFVGLMKDGHLKSLFVHRIVMLTFVGPKPEGMHVNHKDGNKGHGQLANLEYVTPLENAQHASRTGLLPRGADHWSKHKPQYINRGERNGQSKLNSWQVRVIKRLLTTDMKQADIGAFFNVNSRTISVINRGHAWKHI